MACQTDGRSLPDRRTCALRLLIEHSSLTGRQKPVNRLKASASVAKARSGHDRVTRVNCKELSQRCDNLLTFTFFIGIKQMTPFRSAEGQ